MPSGTHESRSANIADLPRHVSQMEAGIRAVIAERDGLLTENQRLKTDVALLQQRESQLDTSVRQLSSERDHYMRFCVELTAQLNNIQVVINEAKQCALTAGFRPNDPTPKREEPSMSPHDEEVVRRLGASFGASNRQG